MSREVKVRGDRLRQLVTHMREGDREHAKFSFEVYRDAHPCGTMGCLLGECPRLWPDHWRWYGNTPTLGGYYLPIRDAMEWFGLTRPEAHNLFYPDGGLGRDAPLEKVLANIEGFLAGLPEEDVEYATEESA